MLKLDLTREQLHDIQMNVLRQYRHRLKNLGIKPSGKTANTYSTEFAMGIIATLDYLRSGDDLKITDSSCSPAIFFSIIRGELINLVNSDHDIKESL